MKQVQQKEAAFPLGRPNEWRTRGEPRSGGLARSEFLSSGKQN